MVFSFLGGPKNDCSHFLFTNWKLPKTYGLLDMCMVQWENLKKQNVLFSTSKEKNGSSKHSFNGPWGGLLSGLYLLVLFG